MERKEGRGELRASIKNFWQVLSHLFYTLTPAQPGILTYSCLIVTLHRNQCSSPIHYPAQTQDYQIQQFGGAQESTGAQESNLLGNSVTISAFSPSCSITRHIWIWEESRWSILFSGNFVPNLSFNESLAEIPVRDNIKLNKYLCFKTVSTMRLTLMKKPQQQSKNCT